MSMMIGVPKEIKTDECRVGLVPDCVQELTQRGHKVVVEHHCGAAIGFSDQDYERVGATVLATAEDVFAQAELIIKVKEPQPAECALLNERHTLFTYLHLAPDPEQTQLLQDSGCIAIAYETVTNDAGTLPLLSPMSEVAGRLAIQASTHCLEKTHGGSGLLLGGVPGVAPAKVVIIGGGVVGTEAIKMAVGLGAQVVVLDKSLPRLRQLNQYFGAALTTVYATQAMIHAHACQADVIVGAVLIPGGTAPKLLSHQALKKLKPRCVLIDVAIDQGGCFATSRPTTHSNPTYIEDDVIHYCVANMPGCVPRTSSFALNNATLPYVLQLCDQGIKKALKHNIHLRHGLNIYRGHVTHQAVALGLNKAFLPAEEALHA
jgi:alanine dehydrogenase